VVDEQELRRLLKFASNGRADALIQAAPRATVVVSHQLAHAFQLLLISSVASIS